MTVEIMMDGHLGPDILNWSKRKEGVISVSLSTAGKKTTYLVGMRFAGVAVVIVEISSTGNSRIGVTVADID